MTKLMLSVWVALVAQSSPDVTVETKKVEYKDGETSLAGYLAWNPKLSSLRPGVLVVHEWWGLNDHARRSAERLAELGYVAFALDMYGEGKQTQHPAEAGKWAGEIRKNQEAWVKRANAGMEILRNTLQVDKKRLAAIGYCFGGSTVLQLAMHDPALSAVVSFHGALPQPTLEQARNIKARILICHGSEDSFIPLEQINQFENVLNQAGKDWVFVSYAGARHGFTNPSAGKFGVEGLRYNEAADRRSWEHMKLHLTEAFLAVDAPESGKVQ